MKSKTQKRPSHAAMLVIGIILYVLSPVLAVLIPPLLEPLICPAPKPGFQIFTCLGTDSWASVIIGLAIFIIGTVLILLSLRLHRK